MVIQSQSSVGAGAFPRAASPSAAVALVGNADGWAAALRAGEPAVVGRTHDGELLLDLRAVADAQVQALVTAVLKARPHA
jgi:L-seryl-tRNA(Ser) seleniumtransferase